MKGTHQLKAFLLAGCLLVSLTACGGNPSAAGSQPPQTGGSSAPVQSQEGSAAAVKSVEVKTAPAKTEYFVGDSYDFSGGVLTVTYLDGSTKDIDMTDSGVEYSATEATAVGNKSVTLNYGGKKASVRFTVTEQGYTVTFDQNYDGAPAAETVSVSKNSPVAAPAAPSRSGFVFYRWYADAACTAEFDFTQTVDQDLTLYAQWQEDGASYHTVQLELNYYGCKPACLAQTVKDGETARTPDTAPVREGYTFDGWYTDAACTAAYGGEMVTGDTQLFAKWTRAQSGENTYVFEAELTDLTGKSGPGFSGMSAETNMIVFQEGMEASGDRYISYLYQMGNSVEFYIASDKDVSNVNFTARLSAEMADFTIDPSNYTISVNDTPVQYSAISFTNVPTSTNDGQCLPFEDYIISGSVSLKEGANVIKFTTSNSDNYVGSGTISGTAPLIDCIKLTTDAVLTWDANYNLPMTGNFNG